MRGLFDLEPRPPMDVLIACETHGVMRDAFLRRGHRAVSCDLLPAKGEGPHIVGDARIVMRERHWDLMIAHPPCPKLTVAAAWCFYHPDDKDLPADQRRPHPDFPERRREQDEAAALFMEFVRAPIERIAVENPVGVMSTRHRKPCQIVQPHQFGDDASKKTCWWLKNLDPLPIDPAQRFPGRMVMDPKLNRMMERWSNQTDSGQNRLGPSDNRWDLRSATYPGIAEACAAHWG